MGWTLLHKDPRQSPHDFFAREFGSGTAYGTLLASRTVGSTVYLAWQKQDGTVFAIVCLTQRKPRDHDNFGYKDMDESMGPVESRCPAAILDLLSPTTSEYALAWRQRCRDYATRLQTRRLAPLERIVLAEPLSFHFKGGPVLLADFIYRPELGRNVFVSVETGALVRIPQYQNYAWERIPA